MKKNYIFGLLLLLTCITVHSQKKSELLLEIENLKTELSNTKAQVTEARRNERVSTAKSESYEGQVKELQEANGTLLRNLNNFAAISNKNSDNINKTLASLNRKENQLKTINNAIASIDSTALIVLTNAKQTLGEDSRIGVSNGAIVIAASYETLFSDAATATISETAHIWLEKVAAILTANPTMAVTIEGLSMTGELDLAALQATAVSAILQNQFLITPDRINTIGKDGNFKEGINLKIHPKYDVFYIMVRRSMKDANQN
ncbi:MAG: hypothetical protein COA50_10925 [Flavobacteriaceae bacterium]|nr:MAG: hypothetical protein COA50_10925 [Flavobacteriaceae bacterium]